MDLKETEILGNNVDKHWYYRTKCQAMQKFLGDIRPVSILDIGAGSGFFSRALLERSTAQNAWCVDISYPQDSDDCIDNKPIYFRREIKQTEADMVLLMDVLEHVDNDTALLQEYVTKVSRGTFFLISVPAFQFLWSGHDVFLEHKRRYRLQEIETVAQKAGLEVLRGSYYFGGVFPIAAALRLFKRDKHRPRSQLKQHHPLINAMLTAVSTAELVVFPFNRFAGLTAFCLARKP